MAQRLRHFLLILNELPGRIAQMDQIVFIARDDLPVNGKDPNEPRQSDQNDY
jgi:hypothetical protein